MVLFLFRPSILGFLVLIECFECFKNIERLYLLGIYCIWMLEIENACVKTECPILALVTQWSVTSRLF